MMPAMTSASRSSAPPGAVLMAMCALGALAGCQRSSVPATGVSAAAPGASGEPASAGAAPAPVAAGATDLVQRLKDALAPCRMPLTPDTPDGATATTQQMLDAHRAFQSYDAQTLAYSQCVDAAVERVVKETAGEASESDLREASTIGVRLHDTAVEQEQVAADRFNEQVRTFKARHPK